MNQAKTIKLLGKPVAQSILTQLEADAKIWSSKSGRSPKLIIIRVGDDPASVLYTENKKNTAQSLGFEAEILVFSKTSSPEDVFSVVHQNNNDTSVDGILIQRPLPAQFNEAEVLLWVSPEKDVDGLHPENLGRISLGLDGLFSCTPLGICALLKHYSIPLVGAHVAILGRSSIVGKPLASLLLRENCTITQCHTKTKDFREHTQKADIVIVATGKKHLVQESDLKPDSVLIDVGIHRLENGKVTGDALIEPDTSKLKAYSPVPGGVGPLTIAFLMKNTFKSAQKRGILR